MADQVDSTSTASAVPFINKDATVAAADHAPTEDQLGMASQFLGLVRFSHTIFALPFALLAMFMALFTPGAPELSPWQLALRGLGVLLCMVFARSAAMAFNRLMDAAIDAENPRTAARHLPSGALTAPQVWAFFAINVIGFFAACSLFLPNWLPLALATPVLVWICGYSLAKRFTAAAHLWLGVALALSPVCSWIAIRGETVIASVDDLAPAVLLAMAIACWVCGFDIIYACQDAEFDRRRGLHSIPAKFGIAGALRIAAAAHLVMLVVLIALPLVYPQLSLGLAYYAGTIYVAFLTIRQHWIIGPQNLERVGEAFFSINALISLGLCTLAAIDTVLR